MPKKDKTLCFLLTDKSGQWYWNGEKYVKLGAEWPTLTFPTKEQAEQEKQRVKQMLGVTLTPLPLQFRWIWKNKKPIALLFAG